MKHWHVIQQQPKLKQIFNQPPIVSYRKENLSRTSNPSPRENFLNLTRREFAYDNYKMAITHPCVYCNTKHIFRSPSELRSHPLLLVLFIVLIKRIRVADCVNKLSWFFNIFQSSRHQLMTYFTSEWFSVAYCCIWQPLLFIPVLKTIARWPSVRCVSTRLFQTRRDSGSCP